MESSTRLIFEDEIKNLEHFIAKNEKSVFNPMYYIDYPEFEKVQASKVKLENFKYALDMINGR